MKRAASPIGDSDAESQKNSDRSYQFKNSPEMAKEGSMLRKVIGGERLSGHGDGSEEYPTMFISDGIGAGNGSMMCSIQSFHWADVVVKGGTTELWSENRICVSIPKGIVEYAE